ncbi:unnamed protein product [Paramecium octaurelia]|uniref:Uncharacterized protein n=1 Tax=Paramecium octaurelia TaxID=43137 RepID=A0A8S1ST27_PAROT|nr:unnamed protein product [Paramecium octaurelia]
MKSKNLCVLWSPYLSIHHNFGNQMLIYIYIILRIQNFISFSSNLNLNPRDFQNKQLKMKSKSQKKLVCVEPIDEAKTQELVVYYWNYGWGKHMKINIQIEVSQDNYILYYKDGALLKKDEHKPQYEIIKNWFQIQNLRFIGDYQNFKKFGKWIAIFDGIELGAGYYDNGLKIGQWKEQWNNYSKLAQKIEKGQYSENIKIGKWNYFYNNKQIGGGLYDQEGVKIGKWIDTNERFQEYSQVTYAGEYKFGKKVGMWYIWKRQHGNSQENRIIGCGLYVEGIKTGFWIEISDGYSSRSEITYTGNYKNGQKVGRWDIWFNNNDSIQGNTKIGGGFYDERGGELKMGQWVDVSDGFSTISQVTFKGEYKNGKKFGKWDIYHEEQQNDIIGGGLYDEAGQGSKIGKWIEISDGFTSFSKVTYQGQYQNGQKVGKWDIWHDYQGNDQIGGGLYDKTGQEVKIGKWIEISDGFGDYSQVTYEGQYKNGKKSGRWNIWFSYQGKHKIGGGTYDKAGKELKVGEWIDVSVEYSSEAQVTYKGKYNQGIKVGMWDIFYKQDGYEFKTKNEKIGGGKYDKEGQGFKIGKWLDISDEFREGNEILYQGEYQSGIKVGNWDTLLKQSNSKEQKEKIGGGQYEEIQGCKIGQWVEICDEYWLHKVTYKGEYRNGKKIGKWMKIEINKKNYKKEEREVQYDK